MADHKLEADSYEALAGFLTEVKDGKFQVKFENILPPTKGRDAVTVTDEKGEKSTEPAKGNPKKWYAAIRTKEDVELELPANVAKAKDEEISAVLGEWA